jgi:hypothetical protein
MSKPDEKSKNAAWVRIHYQDNTLDRFSFSSVQLAHQAVNVFSTTGVLALGRIAPGCTDPKTEVYIPLTAVKKIIIEP